MKILPTNIIKVLDKQIIATESIESIDLMERAAIALSNAIMERWHNDMPVVIFAGPGNNGGDALAIARFLAENDYAIEVYLFNTANNLSVECQINKQRIEEVSNINFHEITNQFTPPILTRDTLVIDALFGAGLNKPLSGGFAAVVRHINASQATVVSIDIPSGLMGEDNSTNIKANIVRADVTLSLQFPKLAFLFAENESIVGDWDVVDLNIDNDIIDDIETNYNLIDIEEVKSYIKPRSKFSHKGNYGHALLVAGSYGMAGAAVLSAKACMRSGTGILTVHSPYANNCILQTTVPTAIIENDIQEKEWGEYIDTSKYQAIAIGPGIGQSALTEMVLIDQINECQSPMILDADALNIIANNKNLLNNLPEKSILTPHPKEFERLVGKCQNSYERLMKGSELAKSANIYIVLKGAFTTIITPDSKFYFNPTGNAGMATGGSGDVLTGIMLALMAQGYSSEQVCKISTFVHGLAGDLACQKIGDIGMNACDIVSYLHKAFRLISE